MNSDSVISLHWCIMEPFEQDRSSVQTNT